MASSCSSGGATAHLRLPSQTGGRKPPLALSAEVAAFGTTKRISSSSWKWNYYCKACRVVAAASIPSTGRKSQRGPRRNLISIGTSDKQGNWSCDYIVSLRDLRLHDLVEDDDHDHRKRVLINISIEKHASFGLSVDGKITTSFTRKCSNCFSPYCKEINATFNVWVLPSARVRHPLQLPEIGTEDPSVIYVKPGDEAHLDSLIQDTLRLTIAVKDTCSEICEKSESTLQFVVNPKGADASIDMRWSRLLELRKNLK